MTTPSIIQATRLKRRKPHGRHVAAGPAGRPRRNGQGNRLTPACRCNSETAGHRTALPRSSLPRPVAFPAHWSVQPERGTRGHGNNAGMIFNGRHVMQEVANLTVICRVSRGGSRDASVRSASAATGFRCSCGWVTSSRPPSAPRTACTDLRLTAARISSPRSSAPPGRAPPSLPARPRREMPTATRRRTPSSIRQFTMQGTTRFSSPKRGGCRRCCNLTGGGNCG